MPPTPQEVDNKDATRRVSLPQPVGPARHTLPMSPTFLTCVQVAERLNVSKMTIYRMAETGTLRSYRFGRSYRFAPADVEAYISGATVEASA